MVDGLISLGVILYGVLGYIIGFYYGKRNYSFHPKQKNVIEITVETEIAEARLRNLKKEVILLNKELEIMNKLNDFPRP